MAHRACSLLYDPLFPFDSEDRRVGIIHADISGLGQLYADLGKAVAEAKNSIVRQLRNSHPPVLIKQIDSGDDHGAASLSADELGRSVL